MVTAERVWKALAEIPDPEIPVLSLVDLGVVRGVERSGKACATDLSSAIRRDVRWRSPLP